MINQPTINLFWAKGKKNAWCSLNQVDFSHSYYDNFEGFIYIIWYWNKFGEAVTIKVGQGNIRERLKAHNTDPQIQAYAHLNLLVTWTSLPSNLLDGAEAYLGKVLKPRVGSLFPDAKPIPVSLPFPMDLLPSRVDQQARPY